MKNKTKNQNRPQRPRAFSGGPSQSGRCFRGPVLAAAATRAGTRVTQRRDAGLREGLAQGSCGSALSRVCVFTYGNGVSNSFTL